MQMGSHIFAAERPLRIVLRITPLLFVILLKRVSCFFQSMRALPIHAHAFSIFLYWKKRGVKGYSQILPFPLQKSIIMMEGLLTAMETTNSRSSFRDEDIFLSSKKLETFFLQYAEYHVNKSVGTISITGENYGKKLADLFF